MFEWLKRLFAGSVRKSASEAARREGTVTRTCRMCGRTFTLPENVQHWPDCCQECRAKYRPVETITRTCRGCGRSFTFESSSRQWPKYCQECRARRNGRRNG